jgi:hypothetical protein
MAEVVDARRTEVPVSLAAGAVVVAKEGERRPGAADDRPDFLAAAVGEEGIAGHDRIVSMELVPLRAIRF